MNIIFSLLIVLGIVGLITQIRAGGISYDFSQVSDNLKYEIGKGLLIESGDFLNTNFPDKSLRGIVGGQQVIIKPHYITYGDVFLRWIRNKLTP